MNEIYIDVGFDESRVAVVDDGRLAEIHIERENMESITGNIYKGVVENVLPGMQAAFVNINLEKNSFLYIKDIMDYGTYNSEKAKDSIPINRLIKKGDELLVQVSKEPAGTKGARVTTHITLPGRFLVLMPDTDYLGVSRRIERSEERDRLKSLVSQLKPEGMGLIVRTEAEGKELQDFIDDISFLTGLWEKIKRESAYTNAPALIHKDADIVFRSFRDLFSRDTEKVLINNKDAYERAKELVQSFSPCQSGTLKYYDLSVSMLDFYGLESEILRALERKVWLKSGGYIVIDQTEALTAIDVNTGKYIGSSNLEQTVLDINLEAASEIALQIRLRDIGGIIIIDFIDMDEESHKMMILDKLKEQLKKDRTKSSVLEITQLGLVEMTRKKISKRLSLVIEKQCPVCNGCGRVLDTGTIMASIMRKLESIFKECQVPQVEVQVNTIFQKSIAKKDMDKIAELGELYNTKILFKGLDTIEYSKFNVKYITDLKSTS